MHCSAVRCVALWCVSYVVTCRCIFFFFQAEDGIRDLVRSRGLGDVYKRQVHGNDRVTHLLGNLRHLQAGVGGIAAAVVEEIALSLIHI